MTRNSADPRKSGLHFEKVPLAEVVEKLTPDDAATVQKQRIDSSGHFHGVQFYNDSDDLCRIVGGFLGEGLEDGGLALVVATPEHAAQIDGCLHARGIDVDAMRRRGSLVTMDARETLQLFMADGMPNPGVFRRAISAALTRVRREREHCTIRVYGEMVDLLWKDRLESAAIRLETLWNQLATTHDFKLLCGYSMGNFYKGAAIKGIHDQHSHLIDGSGEARVLPAPQEESATPA